MLAPRDEGSPSLIGYLARTTAGLTGARFQTTWAGVKITLK